VKRSNILIFVPNLNGGGAERVLINYLNNIDYTKFAVTLVLVKEKGVFLDLVPSEVKRINLNKSKTVYCLLALRRLIKKLQPDIVYSTLIRTSIVLSLAILYMKHKPKVILRSPNSPKLLRDNNMLNGLQEKLLSFAYQNSDLVIAQTQEMKCEIAEFYGVVLNKITVVHNPLNKTLIDSKLKCTLSPFTKGTINVVAAGRLTKQKGFDVLINAFAIINKKEGSFKLHLLGDLNGDQTDNLQELVMKLGLSKVVSFLGYNENPYQYFKYADMYVLSSRWEGLPNTVLECLYLETPVISTNCIATMKDLIKHGDNGFIVDVDNSEQLAKAILCYKDIACLFNQNSREEVNINTLFIDVINNN